MAAAADIHLVALKLELIRILCSHEHYIALNLPLTPKAMMVVISDGNPMLQSVMNGSALRSVQVTLCQWMISDRMVMIPDLEVPQEQLTYKAGIETW